MGPHLSPPSRPRKQARSGLAPQDLTSPSLQHSRQLPSQDQGPRCWACLLPLQKALRACNAGQRHMLALPQPAVLVFRPIPAMQGQTCCGVRDPPSMQLRLQTLCRAVAHQEQLLVWGLGMEMAVVWLPKV